MFDRIKFLIWDIKTMKRQHKAKKELKQAEKNIQIFGMNFTQKNYTFEKNILSLVG